MSKALGRISESFIQDLLSRIDLLELIGERVSLRKAGSHFIGLCPFHKEKTPSFTVHPQKQFYHCFGCGASGDAIEFLRQCEHDDFVGVLETLCQRVGLTLPNIDSGEANLQKAQLAPVYEVLTRAAQYYYDNLSHTAAQPAVGYLKKRGIDGKTAKMFQLGYALPGWDHLISHMGEEADKEAALVQAGLI
ncbi:MAG TPA: CHC2 zinc finger domain-containing protein, partial [Gammaproteobacteria bacterium]|nr:CHC2 zinc finger domain-containing protein [Gammaproteobacteria bacterium]